MLDNSYVEIIESIKQKIKKSQHKALLSANKEMVLLYWSIGKTINEHSDWGSKFIDRISKEIKNDFPSSKGFSPRNLKNMLRFYREYPDCEFVQTVSAQIPWSHNLEILKLKSHEERVWYINKTVENGWSFEGYIPIETRGTGDLEMISLIFQKDE